MFVFSHRDVTGFIKVEQRFFNKEQFLESMDIEDKPFYEKVPLLLWFVVRPRHFLWFLF